MMRVQILGSAAGGGVPQWNCNCRICKAARQGLVRPRTQSSIAIRSGRGPWFLINASPDLRQQLAELPLEESNGIRPTPIGGVVLTDAEIDHTAGLLLLRESASPITVYSTVEVLVALTEHYPVLRVLDSYCGVDWRPLVPGRITSIEGSSLQIDAFETGGAPPIYTERAASRSAVGLTIREPDGGRILVFAPALEALDERITARLCDGDCLLVDGTFWSEDELPSLGLGARGASAMGHAPLAGSDGTLAMLAALGLRTILIHVNNTNPLLLEDSPERAIAEAWGIEVAYDGMEIEL
jgi:pyrroloquinoline quinone biosynthesis protein B